MDRIPILMIASVWVDGRKNSQTMSEMYFTAGIRNQR